MARLDRSGLMLLAPGLIAVVWRLGSCGLQYSLRVLVTLRDGYNLNVEQLGGGFPVIVLHGGPGLDHQEFRPYLDPLAVQYRLVYVDQRGQGRSEGVDPAALSLDRFARDVDLLARALGLDRFAVLGHSFGAIIATYHAVELGTAAAYVISGGADESSAMLADVEASLAAPGEAGEPIAASWEDEKSVETEEQLKRLLRVQMPFHFHREPPAGYGEDASVRRGCFATSQTLATATSTTAQSSAVSTSQRSSSSASTIGRRRLAPRGAFTRGLPAASS